MWIPSKYNFSFETVGSRSQNLSDIEISLTCSNDQEEIQYLLRVVKSQINFGLMLTLLPRSPPPMLIAGKIRCLQTPRIKCGCRNLSFLEMFCLLLIYGRYGEFVMQWSLKVLVLKNLFIDRVLNSLTFPKLSDEEISHLLYQLTVNRLLWTSSNSTTERESS